MGRGRSCRGTDLSSSACRAACSSSVMALQTRRLWFGCVSPVGRLSFLSSRAFSFHFQSHTSQAAHKRAAAICEELPCGCQWHAGPCHSHPFLLPSLWCGCATPWPALGPGPAGCAQWVGVAWPVTGGELGVLCPCGSLVSRCRCCLRRRLLFPPDETAGKLSVV